jgi:hypothetical protein
MLHWLTERRRRHLLETPFPAAWQAILDADVALDARLDPPLRQRLRELTQVFLAEKRWEAAGGLELTDQHRVVIAALACTLLLGRNSHDLYAEVETIIVYPSVVVIPGRDEAPRGEVARGETPILGQAFRRGPVLLAWDHVLAAAHGVGHGNVVFHEFAHKIDMHDGPTDGTPPLDARAERRAWAAAFEPAFLTHQADVAAGRHTFLGDYAATNEAEVFAVATEAYFMRPRALAEELPEVYAQLRGFYRVEV